MKDINFCIVDTFYKWRRFWGFKPSKYKNVGQENPWQPLVEVPIEEESNPKPYNFRAKCEYCGVPLVWCSIRQRQPTQRLIEYLNFGSTSTSCKLTSFNEALTNENISINENKQWMKNTNFYFYYKIIPGNQWRCLQIKISWLYVGLQNEI
jgi:hypothetical protein